MACVKSAGSRVRSRATVRVAVLGMSGEGEPGRDSAGCSSYTRTELAEVPPALGAPRRE